jgi:signal transduction histidine kinase
MEQLIQAEKLAAIGTLVSGIGHEINNPLYSILGMAEAIEGEKDLSVCREYSEDIIKSSKQIAEIVKNLSRYAQPSGSHDLQRVNLNEAISAAVLVAKRSLQSDAIEYRQNTNPLPEILAKSEEIQQVLFNIIRNGIQAMNGQGILEISSRQEDNQVRIQIQDRGLGMPEGNLGKIFDPFFTTKGPDEGEGLGLYIAQQIVQKYDGTISVESREGVGAIFTIQFPIAGSD